MSKNEETLDLPSPIVKFDEDRGSLDFEWYGEGMRLLISFEKNPDDSGWHIVRKMTCGCDDTGEYGSFDKFDPKQFAGWLKELGDKKIE